LPREEAARDEARGEAESSTSEAVEKGPARKRRKRRRRTRKSDLVITPDEAAEEESEILTEPDAVDVFQEECAGALAEFEPAPAEVEEPEAEEKEATEDRSKRRRRRRPGRAKSADQAETESPRQRAGARPVEPKSADEDEESDDADEEPDDADEESLTEESSLVHRGIPTWQEAVGVIISANIEARGKRPSGPPSRPRGGRGRGGHEGSRKPN
jgi:hypothetical protein